jgi:hypothetical protein
MQNVKWERRGQLEYGINAMFTSRGPISLDPGFFILAIEGYAALRDGGEGGGGGGRGGVGTNEHYTTIAFNMADFTLFK